MAKRAGPRAFCAIRSNLVDGLELIRDGQQGFDIGLSGLVSQGLHSSLQGLETKALVLGVVPTTGDGGLGTKVDLRQSVGRAYRIAGLELLDVANEVDRARSAAAIGPPVISGHFQHARAGSGRGAPANNSSASGLPATTRRKVRAPEPSIRCRQYAAGIDRIEARSMTVVRSGRDP